MFPAWFAVTGLVTIVGIAAALIYMRNAADKDLLPPWEAYHRALYKAQVARGRFLRKGYSAITKSLKDRLCCQVRKWHIRFCPLCC